MKYVALLRGIGPSNPNMHQAKLCGVLEKLGFTHVHGVISSGNVVFASDITDRALLEDQIEKAWPRELGFTSTTIVRSQHDLQKFVAQDPYKGVAENPNLYRLVTFFKHPQKIEFTIPHRPEGKPYRLVAADEHFACTVTDLTNSKTPDTMSWLERQFGKEITSRTWGTVQRILKKMED